MFVVEEFVRVEQKITSDNFSTFDLLTKWIDVNRVIYQSYDSEIQVPINKTEISAKTYKSLFEILQNSKDFKFINSAFKLNDLLLKKKMIEVAKHQNNIKELINSFWNI